MKIGEKIGQFLEDRLDIPVEGAVFGTAVLVKGREEMEISGCRSVLKYDGEETVLKMGELDLRIQGEKLVLEAYTGGRIRIRGKVRMMKWEERK